MPRTLDMVGSGPLWPSLGLAGVLLVAAGCGGEARGTTNLQEGDASPGETHRIVEVAAVEHRAGWTASGVLEPARSARLGFLVGGRVAEVRVKRGDRVAAGQVLVRLDVAEVGAGIAQARGAVAAAEAQLRGAEDALGRLEPLRAEGALAEADVAKVRHQRDAAAALRDQARGALQMALVKSAQHVLRAPFDGTVLDAPEGVGGIVGPGIPQVEVADLETLRARVTLPAEAVGRVEQGRPARVVTRDGRTLEGMVSLVLPALDPGTHRLQVEVELTPGPEGAGLANAFVRLDIDAPEAVAAAALPATALVRGEQTTVFVVDDGGMARARPVTVLATEGERAVVLGLEPGSRAIDLPAADLGDGSRVVP